jgi:hypothetical protein
MDARATAAPLLLLAACTTTTPPAGGHAVQPEPAHAPAPASSGYAVHEWGLIDVDASGRAELAAGPGHPERSLRPVRKPVLYVHLADDVDTITFSARVDLPQGAMIEHWPPGQVDGGSLGWSGVTARRARCATAVPSGAPCTAPDGVCELPDLPLYDAPTAACLTLGDHSAGMLFYRGAVPALELPLTVTRDDDGAVRVRAKDDAPAMVGEVLRVSAGPSGPWPAGHVVIARVKVPAPGATVSLPLGAIAVSRAAEETELRNAVTGLGLSGDEADAFVRAWGAALFGEGGGPARDVRSARELSPPTIPQDAILYWLPPAAIERLARLSFDPAPSEIRRAMLVRVDLGAVATAGPGS